MLIQFGDGPINLFSNSGHHLRTAVITLLEMHHKMLTFHGKPVQMIVRVIIIYRIGLSEYRRITPVRATQQNTPEESDK